MKIIIASHALHLDFAELGVLITLTKDNSLKK